MSILDEQRVIAIEEHYYDPNVISHFTGGDVRKGGIVKDELLEVGEKRIKSMNECGIDVQILSHAAPSTQRMDATTGIPAFFKASISLRMISDANLLPPGLSTRRTTAFTESSLRALRNNLAVESPPTRPGT